MISNNLMKTINLDSNIEVEDFMNNNSKTILLHKLKRIAKRVGLYIILIIIAFMMIVPLWSGIVAAFKTQVEILQTSPLLPTLNPTFEPFIAAANELIRPMINSLLFTIMATLFSCVMGSICGFVLTKLKFRGSNIVFVFIILGIFLPYQSIIIPLFISIRDLGLRGTLWGMTLVHSIYGIPITTLLFRSYYENIPDNLLNSAKVDGAGTMTIYRRIILPLSPLPFVVAGVFQFTSIWNDYLFALILAAGSNFEPASFALSNLAGGIETAWNEVMAGTLLYSLPIILLFIFLGKYLMQGLMSGAIKG